MPPAKKATAAELRNRLLSVMGGCYDGSPLSVMLDGVVEAARAEAVAPLEARVAELESERGALVEADILLRARVGEVLDVLRQLVEAMPRCTAGGCGSAACDGCEVTCGLTATRGVVCDEHGDGELDSDYAAPLRAALALLAADKAGAKAGKP